MRRVCEMPVDSLEGLAQPGDLLLYRDSTSLVEILISRGGRSLYGHAGMLAKKGGRWIVLEMIQWHGGRWRYLDDAVRDDPGRWDVFLSNAGNRWDWNRSRAVAEMNRFVGRPYGWKHLIYDGLLHLPLIRAAVPVVTSDTDADRHSPFCSEAYSIACHLAGVDMVPNLPARLTEPGDLARSLFVDYSCTLAKAQR